MTVCVAAAPSMQVLFSIVVRGLGHFRLRQGWVGLSSFRKVTPKDVMIEMKLSP